jgi:hypothetical protein
MPAPRRIRHQKLGRCTLASLQDAILWRRIPVVSLALDQRLIAAMPPASDLTFSLVWGSSPRSTGPCRLIAAMPPASDLTFSLVWGSSLRSTGPCRLIAAMPPASDPTFSLVLGSSPRSTRPCRHHGRFGMIAPLGSASVARVPRAAVLHSHSGFVCAILAHV